MPRESTRSRTSARVGRAERNGRKPAVSAGDDGHIGDTRAHAARYAVGYLRRSTDRQEQSIGDQRAAVEAHAAERGLAVLRHYTDDAISGTSAIGRRAFQELIEDAQREGCPFRYVVVYDVKRFGRVDNDEAGYYRHLLKRAGVEVLYASENFNGDGTDDLLRPVKQWQARQESKDLSKVTIRGLVSKATSAEKGGGWWMGGAPPFGYDLRYESSAGEFIFTVRYRRDGAKLLLDASGKTVRTLPQGETISVSKRDRARLVPSEPERVRTVQSIFRWYAEDGLGFKAIASRLNEKKIPTPRSPDWAAHYTGRWSIASVRAIIVNPAYCGDMVWNRRTDARFHRIDGEGRAVERPGLSTRRLEANDESDWLVTPDAHEALVPRRLWLLAKKRRETRPESTTQQGVNPRTRKRAGDPGWTNPKVRFLLSGLVQCGDCGCSYEGRIERSRAAREHADGGSVARSYTCGGYIRQGRSVCSRGSIAQDELESIVIDAVLGTYARNTGEKNREALQRRVDSLLKAERRALDGAAHEIERAVSEIDARIRTLLDSISPANRAMIDRRLAELATEREALELRRRDAEKAAATQAEAAQLVVETAAFLDGLGSALRTGPVESRRESLLRCVEGVVVKRDKKKAIVKLRVLPRVAGAPRAIECTDLQRAIAIGR